MEYAIKSPELESPLRIGDYFSGKDFSYTPVAGFDDDQLQENPHELFGCLRMSTFKSQAEMEPAEIYKGVLEECLEYVKGEEPEDVLASIFPELFEDVILTRLDQ